MVKTKNLLKGAVSTLLSAAMFVTSAMSGFTGNLKPIKADAASGGISSISHVNGATYSYRGMYIDGNGQVGRFKVYDQNGRWYNAFCTEHSKATPWGTASGGNVFDPINKYTWDFSTYMLYKIAYYGVGAIGDASNFRNVTYYLEKDGKAEKVTTNNVGYNWTQVNGASLEDTKYYYTSLAFSIAHGNTGVSNFYNWVRDQAPRIVIHATMDILNESGKSIQGTTIAASEHDGRQQTEWLTLTGNENYTNYEAINYITYDPTLNGSVGLIVQRKRGGATEVYNPGSTNKVDILSGDKFCFIANNAYSGSYTLNGVGQTCQQFVIADFGSAYQKLGVITQPYTATPKLSISFKSNVHYGAIGIKKTDTTGRALEGVKFYVYNSANTQVATVLTNSKGEATYGLGSDGKYSLKVNDKYYFKEAPANEQTNYAGYILPDTSNKEVTVGTINSVSWYNGGEAVVNTLLGAVKFKKVDGNGDPLEGIKFEVYTSYDAAKNNGSMIETVTSDKDGVVSYGYSNGKYNLHVGDTYYFKEAPAAEQLAKYRSYVGFDDTIYAITVDKANGYTEAKSDRVNYTYGAFKVSKVDSEGNPVEGVKFAVSNRPNFVVMIEDTDFVDYITTDKNGIAYYGYSNTNGEKFSALTNITYYVREIDAPDKYIVDSTLRAVTPKEAQIVDLSGSPIVNYSWDEVYGAVGIKKVDSNGKPLEGVVFNVSGPATKDQPVKITTDKNGLAVYGINEKGYPTLEVLDEYTFVEAPASEQLEKYRSYVEFDSNKVYTAIVESASATPWIANSNKAVVNNVNGAISVEKTDEQGVALEGVNFDIYSDAECKTLVKTITTGSDGKAVYGYANNKYTLLGNKKFYVRESATQSEELSTYVDFDTETVYEVTVTENKVTVINDGKPIENKTFGAYKLSKVDDEGSALTGIKFNVYSDKECTNLVKTITTNSLGQVVDGYVDGNYKIASGTQYFIKEAPASEQSAELRKYVDFDSETVYPVLIESGIVVDVTPTGAIKNQTYGAITATKVDSNDKALSGVNFDIYSDAECKTLVGTMTTDEDGVATYGIDANGKYTVKNLTTLYVRESNNQKAEYKKYISFDTETIYEVLVRQNTVADINKGKAIVNEVFGGLSLSKKGSDGVALSGVVFDVYNTKDCSEKIGSFVTNADGFGEYGIDTNGVYTLPAGQTYYIKESEKQSAEIAGYVTIDSTSVYEVTIVENETKFIKEITNTVNGAIAIEKVDEEDKPLSGVEFTVYSDSACTSVVTKLITDGSGSVSYGNNQGTYSLVAGTTYYVKETAIPDEYKSYVQIDSKVYPVTVVKNMVTYVSNNDDNNKFIDSYVYGSVDIYKHGKVFTSVTNEEEVYTANFTDTNLEGIKFNVFAGEQIKTPAGTVRFEKDQLVGTVTTDNTGHAVLDNLLSGNYYAVEVETPAGYVVDTTKYELVVDAVAPQNVTNLDVYNKLGGVTVSLNKIMQTDPIFDEEGEIENAIKSVVFGLYAREELKASNDDIIPANGLIETVNVGTDNKTVTFSKSIPFGKYYVKEIETAEGFKLDETEIDFEFTANSINTVENISINLGDVENEQISGSILGKKVGNTQEAVTGAVMGLFKANETVFNRETALMVNISDADGVFRFDNVKYGTYLVKEIASPDEYLLNNKTYSVIVNADGVEIPVTVVDDERNITINTNALEKTTGTHFAKTIPNCVINDEVAIDMLIPNREYKLISKLVDKTTGEVIVDAVGEQVVVETTFTAPNSDEYDYVTYVTNVEYKFNATNLEDAKVVCVNYVYDGEILRATEDDLDNEAQSIYFPSARTTLVDSETGNHGSSADTAVTLVDTVIYNNLIPGKEYTVSGKLMDKATGSAILIDGREVVASKTFTATSANGTVDVTFTFDGSALVGKTVVAFETVYTDGKEIITHADINDTAQTVDFPAVHTTAKDAETGLSIAYPDEYVTIIDTVAYENVIVGETYTIEGYVVDTKTGKAITDTNGKVITSSITFLATQKSGTVDVRFEFDGTPYKGGKLVIFEYLYDKVHDETTDTDTDVEVGRHEDITDSSQTIGFPDGYTTAYGKDTGDNTMPTAEEVTIVDVVHYEGLIPNTEYTLTGYVMVKDGKDVTVEIDGKEVTDKFLLDASGSPISNTITFKTPESTNGAQFVDGSVSIEFTFDSTLLNGGSTVIFEDMYYDGHKVFTHHDINDEGQTTHTVTIKTQAKDKETNQQMSLADKSVTIIDTVEFNNLVVGKEYTMTGVLVDKSTGKPFLDAEGKEVTGVTVFKPLTPNGTVDVTFTFNGVKAAGTTLVAFETLYVNNVELATHADINDEGQTISIPGLGTHASDKADGDNSITASGTVTIVDKVEYTNLIPGKTYELKGTIIDKSTGKALVVNGKTVTKTITFTADKADGSVDMEFTFDASAVKGGEYVVFETVYSEGKEVAVHTDINDKDQTVNIVTTTTTTSKTTTTTKTTPDSPKTGDNGVGGAMAVLAICFGTAFCLRKRHEEN